MLTNKEEYQIMRDVEDTHWWYTTLHHMTLTEINQFTPSKETHIIDVGCGTGGLLNHLRKHKYSYIQGFDISPFAVDICKTRGLNVIEFNLLDFSNFRNTQPFNVVVSHDNLYFLNKPERLVFYKTVLDKLDDNGLFILNVPVNQKYVGVHDLAVGIEERFDPNDLIQELTQSGFAIIRTRQWPLILSPLIYLSRIVQRRKIQKNKFVLKSDVSKPNLIINQLLKIIMYIELKVVNTGLECSSMFVVCKKL